jgi:hypothetical protein
MGLIDDKKSIITQLGVFTSIGKRVELPESNNTLPSLNNKNEPIPFMLDMLTVMVGSQALQKTTGEVMTNFVRKSEPQLKTSLTKQSTTHNSDQQLTSGFISGYDLPMQNVDIHGKLKTDPSSSTGNVIYGDNANNFDKSIYNALQNPGTEVTHGSGNGAVKLAYDKTTDKIKVKPVNTSQTIGSFTTSFIGGMTILNEKEFTSRVVDAIFGTVSAAQKKNLTQLRKEEMFNKTLEKISNDEESIDLTEDDLYQLDLTAQNKLTGKAKVDVGCSIIDSDVSIDDLKNLIAGNTGTTDPVAIGRNFGNLIENSFGKNPTQVNPVNKNAIRDGFFKRLIDTIKGIIAEAVTATPQIRILLAIVAGLKNGDDISSALGNPVDDLKNQKNLVKCLTDSATSSLNEFIFNLVKAELIKLIIPVATLILQEKIKAFINILKSLV